MAKAREEISGRARKPDSSPSPPPVPLIAQTCGGLSLKKPTGVSVV